ncbi:MULTISPECIES: hypothetical protein [Lactococcus]|uniref:hypothetical protein n=1 Tax=Lactococcus TaxID=1357 RepID=UPI0007AED5A9|nr:MULTISPECIES: hypothetical protein [Lactococcus]KZK09951.1 hypothetical protein V4_0826 [Lactococcus cremoris]MDU8931469.1 hypothetical protein [Lactococcus cremoris]UBU73266.1 hypothetical protein I6G24_12620 [Lactococcus lactis]
MKKLRESNESLVNFLNKTILALFMISVTSWGIVGYIIPHDTVPLLQEISLKYQSKIFLVAFLATFLLIVFALLDFLYLSKNSPLANIQMKYKLLSFSDSFIDDGADMFFKITDNGVRIEIFFNGTTPDEKLLGKKFSQWLKLPLIEYHEQYANIPAIYVLGKTPKRKDGISELLDE